MFRQRLSDKRLQLLDVAGSVNCSFRSFSHKYFNTPENHIQIRYGGVAYLERYPEMFIETAAVVDYSWHANIFTENGNTRNVV